MKSEYISGGQGTVPPEGLVKPPPPPAPPTMNAMSYQAVPVSTIDALMIRLAALEKRVAELVCRIEFLELLLDAEGK